MKNPSELSREIQHLRGQLDQQFRDGNWRNLANCLRLVAGVAEAQGSMTLCLRAQSFRELLGNSNAGGRGVEAGARLEELYTELQFHLSHLEWHCQCGQEDAETQLFSNSGLESSATLV